MRSFILILLAALALSCATTSSTTMLSGWVSDAHCGVQHVGGKNPDCVRKCMKGGAHIGHPEWTPQAMVLVLDGSEKIVTIANPEALIGREAKHVTVEARVEGESAEIIRVLR